MERNWTEWFEIPVTDMDRAKKFYERLFEVSLEMMDMGNFKMGIFPHGSVGAALCWSPCHYQPSDHGVTVYMNANPDLQTVLDRVEPCGGKVLMPKKQISPEHGFMALFLDSEGNRLALHSEK